LFSYLADASGKKLEDIQNRFSGKDTYFDSEEAVRAGFLDGVIEPVRYYGPANPWGWKISSYRSPLQKKGKKIIELKEKIESEGEVGTVTLQGFLDSMQSYKIIGRLVSHIALNPKHNVRLRIKGSPGGFVEDGLNIYDVMRLINALPNCGNVVTEGSGSSIEGTSALILSAGKERELDPATDLVVKEIMVSAPAHASASRVEEISEEASRFDEMIISQFSRHSNLSPEAIRAEIAKSLADEEKEGFTMSAEEALKNKFVDKVISS
jgi:ATP-dependent protease ClpP protease subunit